MRKQRIFRAAKQRERKAWQRAHNPRPIAKPHNTINLDEYFPPGLPSDLLMKQWKDTYGTYMENSIGAMNHGQTQQTIQKPIVVNDKQVTQDIKNAVKNNSKSQ